MASDWLDLDGFKWISATNKEGAPGYYRLSEPHYRTNPETNANYIGGFKPNLYYRTIEDKFIYKGESPDVVITPEGSKEALKNFNSQFEPTLNITANAPNYINFNNVASEDLTILDRLSNFETSDIRQKAATEELNNNYGGKAWGKLGLWMLGGAAASLGASYALPWLWGVAGSELTGAANLYGAYHGINNLASENGIEKTYNKWLNKDYEGMLWSGLGDAFDITTTALPMASTFPKVYKFGNNAYHNSEHISDFIRYMRNNKNTFGVNQATGDYGWFKSLPDGYDAEASLYLKDDPSIRGTVINFGNGNMQLLSSVENSPKGSQLVFGKIGTNDASSAGNYWMRMNTGGGMHGNGLRFDKSDIKSYWMGANKFLKPGTYASGDMGRLPYGNEIIKSYLNEGFISALKKMGSKPELDPRSMQRMGLSTDSYSSIIRQAQREGNELRWGEGFTDWNDFGVDNKYVYDAWQDWKSGAKTFDEYESIFNDYAKAIGGKPLESIMLDGVKTPVHPHPYIFKR